MGAGGRAASPRSPVSLFAAPGSDQRLGASHLPIRRLALSQAARSDITMPADDWIARTMPTWA